MATDPQMQGWQLGATAIALLQAGRATHVMSPLPGLLDPPHRPLLENGAHWLEIN